MFVSDNYWRDPRVKKEVRALVEQGYEVSVVYWDRTNFIPYTVPIEAWDKGARIYHIPTYGIIKYLPYPLKFLLFQYRAYKKTRSWDVDIVHCHDFDTLRIGIKIKKKRNCRLIYDSHENWELMIRDYHPLLGIVSGILEKRWLKQVDTVITVDKGTTEYIKHKSDKPVVMIENCKNLLSKKYNPSHNGCFTVSYFGTLDNSRMFPRLCDYIGKMNDVKFIIGGFGSEAKSVYRKSKKYENITFLGTVTEHEMMRHMQKSDAILCMFDPSNLNKKFGIPNKFYEALVCGRPIVCTGNSYLGDLVAKLQCGFCTGYSEELVQFAVDMLKENKKLTNQLGKNGLKHAVNKYNWDLEKQKLLEVYT